MNFTVSGTIRQQLSIMLIRLIKKGLLLYIIQAIIKKNVVPSAYLSPILKWLISFTKYVLLDRYDDQQKTTIKFEISKKTIYLVLYLK